MSSTSTKKDERHPKPLNRKPSRRDDEVPLSMRSTPHAHDTRALCSISCTIPYKRSCANYHTHTLRVYAFLFLFRLSSICAHARQTRLSLRNFLFEFSETYNKEMPRAACSLPLPIAPPPASAASNAAYVRSPHTRRPSTPFAALSHPHESCE